MNSASKIAAWCAAPVVLVALGVGGFWLNYRHRTQQVRTTLAQELLSYVDSASAVQSNVISRCTHGCWLGRTRFADGDWVAVAHHSRHTNQDRLGRVGCITVVLTSDGVLYDTYMHYCKQDMFEDFLRGMFSTSYPIAFTNRNQFLKTFYKPLVKLDKNFRPTD